MYCQVHMDEITTQMVLDKPTEEHEPIQAMYNENYKS